MERDDECGCLLHIVVVELWIPFLCQQSDGVNTEEWFQWLASFTGLICRKYADIELAALLQYLANQLKCTESLDLLVLKEILTAMTVRFLGGRTTMKNAIGLQIEPNVSPITCTGHRNGQRRVRIPVGCVIRLQSTLH